MALMVRTVNKAKWDSTFNPVNADAITNCLKTKGNTLSFWMIESEDSVVEGVLAIAASNQNLDSLDIVVVDSQEFLDRDIQIIASLGATACVDLADSHRDLASLNVKHLEAVSEVISREIRADKVKRYNMSVIRQLIRDAIADERIDMDKLHEGIKRKLNVG